VCQIKFEAATGSEAAPYLVGDYIYFYDTDNIKARG
jgi:hypothetical protein